MGGLGHESGSDISLSHPCGHTAEKRPHAGERFQLTTGWDRPRLSAPVIARAGWPRAQVGDESLLVVPRAPSLLSRLEADTFEMTRKGFRLMNAMSPLRATIGSAAATVMIG